MLPEPIQAAYFVANVLENLQIPYFLGGSLASITYGIVRTTQDADIIADIQLSHVTAIMDQLEQAFYIDEVMLRQAVTSRGSLNILHKESLFKVDIFIAKGGSFEKSQFQRARLHSLVDGAEAMTRIATAEDILLSKLDWYRQGGEASERQWRDALGILKVQGERLNQEYLIF